MAAEDPRPLELVFQDITLTVRKRSLWCGNDKAVSKDVLKGVSGSIPAGSLVAILGASGKKNTKRPGIEWF
jgi:ABC-type multidrug transport system ATPase subunit